MKPNTVPNIGQYVIPLVENMVKKNRSRFSIAVLLTTLVCRHITTKKTYSSFDDYKFRCLGACDIPLERYFQDLSSGISHAPKHVILQLQNENKIFVVVM